MPKTVSDLLRKLRTAVCDPFIFWLRLWLLQAPSIILVESEKHPETFSPRRSLTTESGYRLRLSCSNKSKLVPHQKKYNLESKKLFFGLCFYSLLCLRSCPDVYSELKKTGTPAWLIWKNLLSKREKKNKKAYHTKQKGPSLRTLNKQKRKLANNWVNRTSVDFGLCEITFYWYGPNLWGHRSPGIIISQAFSFKFPSFWIVFMECQELKRLVQRKN